MPELPEVETVRRVLETQVLNKTIVGIDIFYDKMIHNIDIGTFKKLLIGKSFTKIERLGKYMFFTLDDNLYLISHLRMEGKYYIKKQSEARGKHEHVLFHFEDGIDLRYDDVRKFGVMEIRNKETLLTTPPLALLGKEANQLDAEYLYKVLRKKAPLKSLLLDQSLIAGIGNIYADEILFMAKLNPLELGLNLTMEDCQNIAIASQQVINKAIAAGGTTIRSYTSSLGVTGRFQAELNVHTKAGESCPCCGQMIVKIKVGGRGTYYCSMCQKLKNNC